MAHNFFRGLTFIHHPSFITQQVEKAPEKLSKIDETLRQIEDTIRAYLENAAVCTSILELLQKSGIKSQTQEELNNLLTYIVDEIQGYARVALNQFEKTADTEKSLVDLSTALQALNSCLCSYAIQLDAFDYNASPASVAALLRQIGATSVKDAGAIRQPYTSQARIVNLLEDLIKHLTNLGYAPASEIAVQTQAFKENMHTANKEICATVARTGNQRKITQLSGTGAQTSFEYGEGYRAAAKHYLNHLNLDKLGMQMRSVKTKRKFMRSTARDFIFSENGVDVFAFQLRRDRFQVVNFTELSAEQLQKQLNMMVELLNRIRQSDSIESRFMYQIPTMTKEFSELIEHISTSSSVMSDDSDNESELSSSADDQDEDLSSEISYIETGSTVYPQEAPAVLNQFQARRQFIGKQLNMDALLPAATRSRFALTR